MKNKIGTMAALLLTGLLLPGVSLAQEVTQLTIDEAYVLARNSYPLSKQRELIKKSRDYSIENAHKGYLPQVVLNGQATYQSDVTQIPIHLPGMDIPTVSKGQYRVYGEVNQTIYDAGLINQQTKAQEANAVVEEQQLEAELYKIRERLNQIFFGILLIDEQLAQTLLVKKDIQLGIEKANAAISNGTAIKSNADVLRAELLKADQRTIELKANRKAYVDMLALFINQSLNEDVVLVRPQPALVTKQINRPELLVFEYQKRSLDIQEKIISSKNKPKLGLFVQTGVGSPSPVNMLSNKFSGYYLGGVRVNWSLSGLYTAKNERALLDINRRFIDVQKENFLFNTNLALSQQQAEILKWQQLMQSDEEIIALRISIKNTASIQLENGLINSSDYLREVNAEDGARQNVIIHRMQLLLAQYQYKTTSGN